MNETPKVGDVVRIKGGGPVMTAIGWADPGEFCNPRLELVWFQGDPGNLVNYRLYAEPQALVVVDIEKDPEL